jgi:hypothetical protein
MTEQEFLDKVNEMIPDMNDWIIEKAKHIIQSGAIDLESYENNYLLPKIFISAMGAEIRFQYKPHATKDIKLRNNIESML